ncbi:alpha/beta hydrolase protein [Rhizophagus irregularis DAOM 181602=DAOM 197198]|nr:alpha/beta hydrolase protein [Rhizophagus irregularis DAOM 181602=DAOM 197198]
MSHILGKVCIITNPEWKNLKDDGIITENYRCITSSLAKIANARVLALNPKNIVICDNSAGDDECSDYIRNMKRGTANYAGSQASKEYKEKEAALIKNSPKIWHDSFERPDGRLQL